jgi:hypothetical protein
MGYTGFRSPACRSGATTTVLYFGDFDPSGEDMVRSLRERFKFFECHPEIVKCALTADDVAEYNLPPDFTKPTDTRRASFVARYGDMAVELDALPVNVLVERLREGIGARIDLEALGEVDAKEDRDREQLVAALQELSG